MGKGGVPNKDAAEWVQRYVGEVKKQQRYIAEWKRLKRKAFRGLPLTPDEVTFVREMTYVAENPEPEEEILN